MNTLHHGDALTVLRTLPTESVNCIVTSPPYFGLRDYGVAGQYGLERTPAEFIANMTAVFTECRRVLRKDGVCWVNIGDSYARQGGTTDTTNDVRSRSLAHIHKSQRRCCKVPGGIKEKDLMGIPWRLAFALQDDGWYLRQDVIWSKPNPMPESVRDRCTRSHEYLFMFTKSKKYWYDSDAIRTEPAEATLLDKRGRIVDPSDFDDKVSGKGQTHVGGDKQRGHGRRHAGFNERWDHQEEVGQTASGANCRSVWEIATRPFSKAHFATFPPEIPKRCILAGCPAGGVVLDPFLGSGTTLMVAAELGRNGVGIELNPEYLDLARKRIADAQPALAGVA